MSAIPRDPDPEPRTRVVKLQRRAGKVVQGCDVYIGRACNMGGWKLPGSKWQNPYSVQWYPREKCLELYEGYLRSKPELLAQLPELRGKTLGCWCAPEACHGDVLIKLLKERDYSVMTQDSSA